LLGSSAERGRHAAAVRTDANHDYIFDRFAVAFLDRAIRSFDRRQFATNCMIRTAWPQP
jgi:hypothetical protein